MHQIKYIIILSTVILQLNLLAEVAVEPAKIITVSHNIRLTGTIEAINQGTASSQTSGQVKATLVDVGDLVEKNDVILILKDTKQQASLDTAKAEVEAARAQYSAAIKEFHRTEEIRAKKLVSQSVMDNTRAKRDTAKASLDAALGRLKEAQEQLEYTKIRAPYSGIVQQRFVEVGETVHPGTALYSGMSLNKLRITVNVPQKDINTIRNYRQARVVISEQQEINIDSNEMTFFGYADPKTLSFKIRLGLPEGIEGLYPGMYLSTFFKIGEQEILTLPAHSIVHRGEVTAVYIQTDKKVGFRQVSTGRTFTDREGKRRIRVLSGVKEGELILLNPSDANRQQNNLLDSE